MLKNSRSGKIYIEDRDYKVIINGKLSAPYSNEVAAKIVKLPDGNLSLTATGVVGGAYRLWASANVGLTPITSAWTLLSSGTVTTNPLTINDLVATNFPQRFYQFSNP